MGEIRRAGVVGPGLVAFTVVMPESRLIVLVTLVAVVSMALLAGCTSTLPAPAPHPNGPVSPSEVSGAGAIKYLQPLQQIADRNGGNRATPGPGYEASVDYVAGVLRAAGYRVDTPSYTVSRRHGTTARDVVAQTTTGATNHVVMLGAHLDSVRRGPGINDNGSGVAALLEIATQLGGSPTQRNAIRFAFWGSEEDELQGSTGYVSSLSSGERESILLYINVDMVASPNIGYFVQGGAGRDTSESGPPGSATVGQVLADQLTAAGATPRIVPFERGDSDFEPFVDAGIASGGVQSGDEEEKTRQEAALWGGQAGADFDSCYHQACDRTDNVNAVALDRYTDALAATANHFAASSGTLTH